MSRNKSAFGAFHFAPSQVSSGSSSETPFGLQSPPKDDPLDNDSYSLASGQSQTQSLASEHESLIFERLVQDPLTSGTPIGHSLPRHVSRDTFIPSSLDTATLMDHIQPLDHADAIEFGFNSRRSSLANLEAALAPPASRRGSSTNLAAQQPFLKRGSYSQASLSRTSSNLTQQLAQTTTAPVSRGPPSQAQSAQLQSLPPLSVTRSGCSITAPRSATASPASLKDRNKSFCSYADIIALDDNEMKSPIRRPSISASLSNSFSMARTNSLNSSNARSATANASCTPGYRPSRTFRADGGDDSLQSSGMDRKNSEPFIATSMRTSYSAKIHSNENVIDDDE